MMLISPFKILNNCGISSKWILRISLPTGVIRFDRGQRVRDRLACMIDVVIAVVLPEPAWGDADAEPALHFLLCL